MRIDELDCLLTQVAVESHAEGWRGAVAREHSEVVALPSESYPSPKFREARAPMRDDFIGFDTPGAL